MDASKRLTIRVSGDVEIEAISVGLFDTIYDFLSIENLFDGGNSYFVIHNEQILSPSFTFSFLNIQDNDDLVVFKKRPKLKLTEHKKFVKPTNDMISQMYRQKYSRKTEKC